MLVNLRDNLRTWNRNRIERSRIKRETETAHDFTLGVLGIMKNEAMNIDEWVQHYLSMGAGKIFLIDNGSTDETVVKAKLWAEKGVVELVEYPERHSQTRHYWSAFKQMNIGRKCKWLIVADLDEFWFCPSGETIAAQMEDFRDFDVIYGNWRVFGSNGLAQHPASIRQALTLRMPGLHFHTGRKYMCRTAVINSAQTMGVHTINGARSERTVSDNERFHINHYVVQSLEFFQTVKMTRGSATKAKNDDLHHMQFFEGQNAAATLPDNLLSDLVTSGKIK